MAHRVASLRPPLVALIVTLGCAKPDAGPPQGTPAARSGSATAGATSSVAQETSIIVNGQALSAETIQLLQQVYPVSIARGRYWYDPVSGAYGRDGEPIAGMMASGLSLGGPLSANASRGTSGVFINGRQVTVGEKVYLERVCQTPVIPARYWIAANGIGGLEGGPATFNLAQCPGLAQQGNAPRSMSRTFCDANGACTSTGILGSILTAPDE